jgi:hypothetical protein
MTGALTIELLNLEEKHSYKFDYSGFFTVDLDGRKCLILFGRGGAI